MHGFGGPLAVLHRLDGEVLAEADAVAAGIHPRDAGAQLFVDLDALAGALEFAGQRVAQRGAIERLADGLEDRVGGQLEGFPGGLQPASTRRVRAKRMPRTRPWASSSTSSGAAQVSRRT